MEKDISPYTSSELSWLSFNERVLQEASDHRNPLFERIKFLAIYSSNLDEFFKVKVSQLRQIKKVEKPLRKKLILQPNKKLKTIHKVVHAQQERFGDIFFKEIVPELAMNGILLLDKDQFTQEQSDFATAFFKEKLMQKITLLKPLNEEVVFLEDGLLYLTALINKKDIVFISLPVEEFGRFVKLPNSGDTSLHCYTSTDEIVKKNIDKIITDCDLSTEAYSIKLSRDAELYLDDDYDGALAEQIYENLSQRKKGQATRLLYDFEIPKKLKKLLKTSLGLGKADMIPGGRFHNFSDFFSFNDPTQNASLHFEPKEPIAHQYLESSADYFETISKKDQLVHFPYQSFKYVQEFIEQAANDPLVTTIKISLYRVAKKSALTDALLAALDKGKKVVVFIEAQARFDEENNILWGRTFEAKGATVFYSFPKIKVHSKILMIERQENKLLKRYAYIGTGNFNAKTSKLYCDHGLFTSNQNITAELAGVFQFLERKTEVLVAETLLVSPFTTRATFTDLINTEIQHAQEGKKAVITAKMNSLQDAKIISKLYEASQAGVQIRLLIRGICNLKPGIENLSENITVTSIVDRYLEHGRIFHFENGGNEKIYMGSADWMTRNLDRRIEVITPTLDPDIFTELKDILQIQLNDTYKSRIIDSKESNDYLAPQKGEQALRSQYEIFDYLRAKLR
ncbi:polyphosphate kinase 1 [Flavobacteriaceae bacterium R38]|nr:polyphosphate kinase 1 [Flavobacteriaceae bacterium R38]